MKETRNSAKVESLNPATVVALLFKRANRGLLLDIVVFSANLFLMRLLVKYFLLVAVAAGGGDTFAGFVMFAFCLALFVLPPAGAILKRWHFHERMKDKKPDEGALAGCLFNPIFYFCLTAVIFSTINAFILQYFYGNSDPGGGIFVSSILIGLVLMIIH